MKVILEEVVTEFLEKKSKFITYLKPVRSVAEANEYIESIKELHKDATHNVPLYRVLENNQEYFKYNDDGEPVGTAAKPMADIVERKELYNIAMVVTRYFGGIKLGAGGLIRNYARAAKEAVQIAQIVDYVEKKLVIISFDYSEQANVDRIINTENIEIIEKSYLEKVNLKLFLTKEQIEAFNLLNVLIVQI